MSTTDTTVTPERTSLPEQAPPMRTGVVVAGCVLAALLGLAVLHAAGWKLTVLYLVGLALGLVLFHSRFGFTSAWRQLVTVGQGKAVRAHMVMLACACVLFSVLLGGGFGLSGPPNAMVQPAGLGVVLGAFLFGTGMQVGGSCASGTLFSVGSGHTAIAYTLGGFIAGSVLSAFAANWIQSVQSIGPTVSLAATPWGYPGALALTLLITAAVIIVSLAVERHRRPPAVEQPPVAGGVMRFLRGSWPVWAGALLLGALNAVTLFVSGHPWGITSAFGLWGAKMLNWVGIDISGTPFWSMPDNAVKLHASVLTDRVSVMDFGIMIGALIASALAGAFVLHRRVPWRLAAGAVLGGVAMGFGARLAGGCNIGAYFSGVASFSLHGWLWGVCAIAGAYAGVRLRPLFGLRNPKPSDAVC